MTSTTQSPNLTQVRRPAVEHWPVALGLAAAAFQVVAGVAAEAVAITVTVAASCYLAAAALGRPWVAWAGIVAGSVVVVLSEIAGVTWWLGLMAFAAVLVVIGVLRRAQARPLSAQAVAMTGFGGLAVIAVLISPRLGLALSGIALASHAAWDYLHWRRKEVVPRSLAEFCIALDLALGITAIVLAITR